MRYASTVGQHAVRYAMPVPLHTHYTTLCHYAIPLRYATTLCYYVMPYAMLLRYTIRQATTLCHTLCYTLCQYGPSSSPPKRPREPGSSIRYVSMAREERGRGVGEPTRPSLVEPPLVGEFRYLASCHTNPVSVPCSVVLFQTLSVPRSVLLFQTLAQYAISVPCCAPPHPISVLRLLPYAVSVPRTVLRSVVLCQTLAQYRAQARVCVAA
eukprot:2226491-Rhodomonas_salina.1